MLAPERRTRADIIFAVAIAVVVSMTALVVWARGDATGTESVTASTPVTAPPTAEGVPASLRELWHAEDGASKRALVSAGVVVTAQDGTVSGRDPRTGEQVWHYRRDMPLCGVESQFSMVLAVYRDERGCSQTTLLAGDSGARRTARSSYMDATVRLSVDGTYALAQGPRRLEMWRSDLVRTIEYGFVDAQVNAKTQPRKGCDLLSSASNPSRLAVLERCPDDPADRLTVLNPVPKDNTVPEEYGSHVLSGGGADSRDARVLAVSDTRILVYLPEASAQGGSETVPARLAVYDANGNPLVNHRLLAPLTATAEVTKLGSTYFLFTGETLLALNGSTFDPLWNLGEVLGTPAMMAGSLLVPVTGGIAAIDPATGTASANIPVDRAGHDGSPLALAVIGGVVLEKRGSTIHALG
ncbi:Rv3212 family protein [Nocardia bovistercoris]|uniref:PQQ-binding-like beta-propeller repeat protein n=1 Tax=Nocardia bovistercoris TaxID=2785916 RepID=A0A931N183_9NOCA|nr:PQQ-binding-like beta-propeller repeat protein [Nocardia bovistercoris]MBH0775729.1 PQQ-binding-like beta-propeller repeat protein [Nocardia bovistercoris]